MPTVSCNNIQGSNMIEPTSELLVKWLSRPTKILHSPFIAGGGKLWKHVDNVVVFENYKNHVEDINRSVLIGWFQRGYKPKNRHVDSTSIHEHYSSTYCNTVT